MWYGENASDSSSQLTPQSSISQWSYQLIVLQPSDTSILAPQCRASVSQRSHRMHINCYETVTRVASVSSVHRSRFLWHPSTRTASWLRFRNCNHVLATRYHLTYMRLRPCSRRASMSLCRRDRTVSLVEFGISRQMKSTRCASCGTGSRWGVVQSLHRTTRMFGSTVTWAIYGELSVGLGVRRTGNWHTIVHCIAPTTWNGLRRCHRADTPQQVSTMIWFVRWLIGLVSGISDLAGLWLTWWMPIDYCVTKRYNISQEKITDANFKPFG